MDKLVLYYLGDDSWNRPIYKSDTGRLFKDTNLGDGPLALTTVNGGLEGEPDTPIEYTVYKDAEICIINQPSKEDKFRYMMLDRLRSDCDYYLGYGNRKAMKLWGDNPEDHIKEMKRLYNELPKDAKPEWLTWEQILDYEKQMTQP